VNGEESHLKEEKIEAQLQIASQSNLPTSERIYDPSCSGAIRQGEILTNLIQIKINLDSLRSGKELLADRVEHKYAIVITQDCDVIQDFTNEKGKESSGNLPNTLLCQVVTAEQLRGREDIKSDIWKRIRQNKDERYQFLEKVSVDCDLLGEGLPELGIDFKRYFTVPTDELYFKLETEAKRRCRLISPYLEHFSNRFYSYQSRIALPADHRSE